MSVNGFYYKPHLGLNEQLTQNLDFVISEKKPSYFSFEIKTNIHDEDFFRIEDFDRIDICYMAFVKYDKNQEVESNVDHEED